LIHFTANHGRQMIKVIIFVGHHLLITYGRA